MNDQVKDAVNDAVNNTVNVTVHVDGDERLRQYMAHDDKPIVGGELSGIPPFAELVRSDDATATI